MIRYGVIGTGMMGIEHIENVIVSPHATVTALADPYAPSLARARAVWSESSDSVPTEFTDHRALLESDLCDAVIVATPNYTHVDVLLDAFETDLPILVEKPLCSTVEDCLRVVAAADGREAAVWVALEYRYMAPIARLVEEIRRGTVGESRMISIREHRFPFLHKVGNWNRFNRYSGGTLVEKCCHFFDLMNFIADSRPVRVMASGDQDVNHLDERYDGDQPDVLDNAYIIVDYASGARGLVDLCMFADASWNQEEVVVAGDRGKVEAFVPEGTVRIGRRGEHTLGEVQIVDAIDKRVAHIGQHFGSSYIELLRFTDAVRDGSPPEVTLEDGMLAVAMGVAGHRSIEQGRPVAMDEVLPATP